MARFRAQVQGAPDLLPAAIGRFGETGCTEPPSRARLCVEHRPTREAHGIASRNPTMQAASPHSHEARRVAAPI